MPYADVAKSVLWTVFTVNQCMLSWTFNVWTAPPRIEEYDWLSWSLHRMQLRLNNLGPESSSYSLPHPLPLVAPKLGPLLRRYTNIERKHRVIFSYYRHPLRQRGQLVARCLQLLLTAATTCLPTAELMHCKDLLTLVRQWNETVRQLWIHHELPDRVTFWELDIVAMFPNLSRDRVWAAVQVMFQLVRARRRMRGSFRFAINKIDRKLDRIGSGSRELFTNFTQQDVLHFVEYDIFHNDVFVYMNVVLCQVRGIAIGGTCSSQYACTDCMICEHRFLNTVPPYALQGPAALHPCILPVRPGRFTDNCLGMKFASSAFEHLQKWPEGVYNLELQCEGVADTWITVQGELDVTQASNHAPPVIRIRLADKSSKFTAPHQKLIRFPDNFALKASRTLQSLVPAMAKNCGYYRDTVADASANIGLVIEDLQTKTYPRRWWVPSLRGNLDKWGLPVHML